MGPILADDAAARTAFTTLRDHLELDGGSSGVTLTGYDPAVAGRHRFGAASAAALAAYASGIAHFWEMGGGRSQSIGVDLVRAVLPGLRTSFHLSQNGQPIHIMPKTKFAPIDLAPTRDGRLFWFVCTSLYPELLLGALDVLGCPFRADALYRAIASRTGEELEDTFAARSLPGVFARTAGEWAEHPQGALLTGLGPVHVERIGDSAPRSPAPGRARPLSGVRVLDVTHVLAGPLTSRIFAEHGADVLHVSPPHEIETRFTEIDTGVGKRSTHLDFTVTEDAARARDLADRADIFVTSWRTGSFDRFGLAPCDLAARNPGIIYVSVSAYGSQGPWARRGGYDPVGQIASGLAMSEHGAGGAKLAPTFTMNDYLTAYLAAAGVASALVRRAREGGSYHVQASLTQASMWLLRQGVVTPGPATLEAAAGSMIDMDSAFGWLRFPAPVASMSETPPGWDRAPEPFGASPPIWL
nr:CoA transferase [Mesorhizobium sp.]